MLFYLLLLSLRKLLSQIEMGSEKTQGVRVFPGKRKDFFLIGRCDSRDDKAVYNFKHVFRVL